MGAEAKVVVNPQTTALAKLGCKYIMPFRAEIIAIFSLTKPCSFFVVVVLKKTGIANFLFVI